MKFNLFIVGTVKGGTTWLYDALSTHPKIFGPAIKEPHFFTPYKSIRTFHRSIDSIEEYSSVAATCGPSVYVMDGSATYMSDVSIPEKIATYNNSSKIIIMLRHPVKRAFSQFLMDYREGLVEGEFLDVIERDHDLGSNLGDSRMYIRLGLYYRVVEQYIRHFSKHNVLIVTYSDLLNDPSHVLSEVCRFLSIRADFDSRAVVERKNIAALPKNRIARRILASDKLRRWAGRIAPAALRRRAKTALLKKNDIYLSADLCSELYNRFFLEDSERLFGLIGRRCWDEYRDI